MLKQTVSTRSLSTLVSVCALASLAGSALAQRTQGPDVIVGELPDFQSYGPVLVGTTSVHAFAVGTTSCNKGNETLIWIAEDNRHPVIGQNMYRWRLVDGAGQFDQVGQSWLKHGFTALQMNACSLGCNANPNGDALGVGCSDPYTASLNGSQGGLGPRSQVNAYTGYFPYPFTAAQPTNALSRRLQVRGSDLAVTPITSTTMKYFVEGHYVAADDAAAGNGFNNASYRRVVVNFNSPNFRIATASGHPTRREQAGIFAWAEAESGVTVIPVNVPGEGRFYVASKVTPLSGGVYHYEYAIQNLNSDRSASWFRVNGPGPQMESSLEGFRDVDYHSGEPYTNTDWTMSKVPQGMVWANDADFATNPNANALRWGTMYSFRFRSTQAPVMGTGSLGLFKPGAAGAPNDLTFALMVPGVPTCPSIDFNNDGLFPSDDDLVDLLAVMAGGACSTGNCNTIDVDGNGLFPSDDDLVAFLDALSGGC
jgi:hypothetical protein